MWRTFQTLNHVFRGPAISRGLAACLLAFVVAVPALAEKRVALVIGNGAYNHAPALANPKNDAESMAAALKRLGFDVLLGVDLDRAVTERLLESFEKKLDGAEVALFFYAGHGLQVNGRNFLVPVDAKLEREAQLNFQAVSLDLVQTLMEQSQRTNVIILDACRDNPLARSLARSMGTRSTAIGNGLAQVQGGRGTLIVYATQPGNVALDGSGKNSPFTAALLEHIETPGLEVRQVLTRVRASVTKATADKQLPWEATSLIGDFYFAPQAVAPETKPPAPPVSVTPPAPPAPGPDQETVFWQSIKDSKNAADFKAYLEKYPNGTFASLAKIRIAEVEKAAVTPPAPAPERREPQPPAPSRMQRSSTFEIGVGRDGDYVPGASGTTPSAKECQQRCIARPQCVAWNWYDNTTQFSPRYCQIWRSVKKTTPNFDVATSGVIRTTPAAAPAQPPAPKTQQVAPAKPGATPQASDLAAEIRRKANARENEDGFCARTNWPKLSPMELVIKGLPAGQHLEHFPSIQCTRWQIDPEFVKEGIRFRIATKWICSVGKSCFALRNHYCYNVARSQWMIFDEPNPTDFSRCR